MANEKYKIDNPTGTNRACQEMQERFSSALAWLDTAYGEAFRNVRSESNELQYYPAVFKDMDSKQYVEIVPDVNEDGNTLFFYVESPSEYVTTGIGASYSNVVVNAVFFADLRKVRPMATHRANEEMKKDIIDSLLSFPSKNYVLAPNTKINVFEEFKQVYEKYSYKETDQMVNMSEYCVMRVRFSIVMNNAC